MINKRIVSVLDDIADRYIIANDTPRVRAFRSAARNLELLNFEITKDNISDIEFKGLGKSTIETVKEFVETNKVVRHEELDRKYPPIEALELLDLYNMDLQYIIYLWQTYRISSVTGLWKIKQHESRANKALEELGRLNTEVNFSMKSDNYTILGDCGIQTTYGQGKITIENAIKEMLDRGYRHGFITDYVQGTNTSSNLDLKSFRQQKEKIKERQIEDNIRIWQGLVVDISLNGTLLTPLEMCNEAEFLVVRLSTHPHTDVVKRIEKGLKQIPIKIPIILNCLDKYCEVAVDVDNLNRILKDFDVILGLTTGDYITAFHQERFLKQINFSKIAIMSFARDEMEYDHLNLGACLLNKLNIEQNRIINCLPHPFKFGSVYTSTAGIQNGQKLGNQNDNKLERIQNTLKRMQKLQQTRSHLKNLFEEDSSNE